MTGCCGSSTTATLCRTSSDWPRRHAASDCRSAGGDDSLTAELEQLGPALIQMMGGDAEEPLEEQLRLGRPAGEKRQQPRSRHGYEQGRADGSSRGQRRRLFTKGRPAEHVAGMKCRNQDPAVLVAGSERQLA